MIAASDYLQSRLYCAFQEHAAHAIVFTVFFAVKQQFGVSAAAADILINNRPAVNVGELLISARCAAGVSVFRPVDEVFGFNIANQRGGNAV